MIDRSEQPLTIYHAADSVFNGFVHLYYLCVYVCVCVELYTCLHACVCLFCFVHMFSLCVCVCVCFLPGGEPILDGRIRSKWVRPQVLCAETARAQQWSAILTWHKHWLGQQHCHLQTNKHYMVTAEKHTLCSYLAAASLVFVYNCWTMLLDILCGLFLHCGHVE